jgi:hypothetical protein
MARRRAGAQVTAERLDDAVKTIVRHRACDTDIFEVEGSLHNGDVIPPASAWRPLRAEWPQPQPWDETICRTATAGS